MNAVILAGVFGGGVPAMFGVLVLFIVICQIARFLGAGGSDRVDGGW